MDTNNQPAAIKYPMIDLATTQIDQDLLTLIPEVVAKKYKIMPVERKGDTLTIAATSFPDLSPVENLEKKLGIKIQPVIATPEQIESALKLYDRGSSTEFHTLISNTDLQFGTTIKGASIAKIVQKLFEYALDNRASDIHIEPMHGNTVVRFRIDGVLHDIVTIPKLLHEEMVSRIKVLSRLRTDEHQTAQDGKLQVIYGQEGDESFKENDTKEEGETASEQTKNKEDDKAETQQTKSVDIRVSIAPVTNGENVVMRLLSEQNRDFTLANLGFSELNMKKIQNDIAKSWGTIIVVGPTGSGKSTTLYAILKILNKREIDIATIEDPVEYDMEGVSQIQVNEKTDLTFANGLRSIVRQDPDIIMVGEIRDKETAAIAINAAMTGHLVLTTLHANDAATTLPRMIQMDVEPYLIASTINLVVAQRIVRRVCPKCAAKYEEPFEVLTASIPASILGKYFIKRPEKVTLVKGKGCVQCHDSGYLDRVGIFEILTVTPEIEKLILAKSTASQIVAKAVEEGMITMIEDGLQKVINGTTTLDEILRVTRE